jgi:hypothetical protein
MKALCAILLFLLCLVVPWLYIVLPFPAELVLAGEPAPSPTLAKEMPNCTFLHKVVPSLTQWRALEPRVKGVRYHQYYPFTVQAFFSWQNSLISFLLDGDSWEWLESGEMIKSPDVRPTVTASFYTTSLPTELSLEAIDLLQQVPTDLHTQIIALQIAQNRQFIVKLSDGLELFFRLERENYQRHLPFLQIYVEKARKDGKRELHFEFADVFAK